MKLGKWKHAATHTPKRTFAEMAEEFGLSMNALRARMQNSKANPPSPSLKTGPSMSSNGAAWYDPIEMRAWWRREQEARATK